MAVRSASTRPHPAGLVNVAAAAAVLLVILLVALRTNTSPPAIAEFAPATQQNIKDAPQEQGSSFGSGATVGGGLGPGGPSGGTTAAVGPTPKPTGPPTKCIGDPPRQIEDPQSPPCVPFWSGPNGGATSRGVEGSSISMAWVFQGNCPGPGNSNQAQDQANALARFFNKRFQFYGRQVAIHCVSGGVVDSPTERAIADGEAAKSTFASTQYTDQGGLAYHTELARKGVVSSFGFETNPSEALLARYDPYLWSYSMTAEGMLAEIGNWYCSELAGHPAIHAGPLIATQPRRLGVVYKPWDPDLGTNIAPLNQALSRCGVAPFFIDDTANNNPTNAALALKQANVTSVLCVCEYAYWAIGLQDDAASQGYYPEWLVSGYGGSDSQLAFHLWNPPASQTRATFGLTWQPRQEVLANTPMWWAVTEGGGTGAAPTTFNDMYQLELMYRSFLEIMSGFQMAGPGLTPASFGAGLHHALFPNPVTPLNAGFVDFFGGSHAMTVDAAEWWFDPTAASPWTNQADPPGAICYVDHGRRFGIAAWPRDHADRLFQGPCDSGA